MKSGEPSFELSLSARRMAQTLVSALPRISGSLVRLPIRVTVFIWRFSFRARAGHGLAEGLRALDRSVEVRSGPRGRGGVAREGRPRRGGRDGNRRGRGGRRTPRLGRGAAARKG